MVKFADYKINQIQSQAACWIHVMYFLGDVSTSENLAEHLVEHLAEYLGELWAYCGYPGGCQKARVA